MGIAASSTPDGLGVELVASFDAFYVHEYPATVRLLTALTGRRDIAEELAQDVFVTAHARWHAVAIAAPQPRQWRSSLQCSASSLCAREPHRRTVPPQWLPPPM